LGHSLSGNLSKFDFNVFQRCLNCNSCFNITNRNSFREISFWFNQLKETVGNSVITHVCGKNKNLSERAIEYGESEWLFFGNDADDSEVCAKTGEGIQEIFENVFSEYQETKIDTLNQKLKINIESQEKQDKSGYCSN
jgi:hypothetical protein